MAGAERSARPQADPLPMKKHHHNGPVLPQPNSRIVIHETIATRAYEIWVGSGKPTDQSDEIWLAAERELHTEQAES